MLLVLEGELDLLDEPRDEVLRDLWPSLSKLMSNRLDMDLCSGEVSVLKPLLLVPSSC